MRTLFALLAAFFAGLWLAIGMMTIIPMRIWMKMGFN